MGERETLERLAVDEASLEQRIVSARRDAAGVIEAARQEAERIAGDARALAEKDLARLRADAAAALEREAAERRVAIAREVAEQPRRAEANRERAVERALETVLGRRA